MDKESRLLYELGYEQENKMTDNMKLWNSVCETDEQFTKKVNQRGGFTAIGAQYQIRMATEQWGPYGGSWGVKNLNYRFIEPFVENEKPGIMLTGAFYYPGGDFEMAVDMPYKSTDDCTKKLLTDLTTKALSKLGFNADVFMGRFDDNKYVEARSTGGNPQTSKPETKSETTYVPNHAGADEYAKIKNSDGVLYSELDLGALVFRFNALEKKLKTDETMTTEERSDRELKRDAAKYYIETKKGN